MTLPFSSTFSIQNRSGDELVEVPGRLWKDSEANVNPGRQVNYGAVCDDAAAPHVVGKQNRILICDGEEYRVGDATHFPTIGYVELGLTRVLPNG